MSCSLRRIASNYLVEGGELISNPIVEIGEDGVVVSVGQYDPANIDRMEGVEHYSGVMVAGLVNAHCHLELSYLKGVIPPGGGFAAFASGMAENRGRFSDEERVAAMRVADRELRSGGVVAVGDILNGVSSYELKSQSDVEYVNFAELFGLRSEDTSAIDPLLNYPSTYPTPHSLYSLNDDLLSRVVQMSSCKQSVLSIHFKESESEDELFKGRGRLYEWYSKVGFECDFLHYESAAHRLISVVPPDRSVMLVHNCCVTQRDIDMIMDHFTAEVYWTLCPRSNSYISGLKPPVDLLRSNGLNITVGTDSLASNSSLSILEELRALESDAKLAERLKWATENGAKSLNLNHLGEIKQGMHPAINILSNLDYKQFSLTPESQITRIV